MIRCERCLEPYYNLAYIVYSEDMKPMQVCRRCGIEALGMRDYPGPGRLRVKPSLVEGEQHEKGDNLK